MKIEQSLDFKKDYKIDVEEKLEKIEAWLATLENFFKNIFKINFSN